MSEAKTADAEDNGPWRMEEKLKLPGWLRVGLSHRQRTASLTNDFRNDRGEDHLAQFVRTLAHVGIDIEGFQALFELQDSRAYVSDAAPLTGGEVNTLAILQAYVGYRSHAEHELDIKFGRLTIDVGKRRIVARNRYRNTSNNFTGLDASFRGGASSKYRVFAVMPIARRPSDYEALESNEYQFDEENTDALFLGAHTQQKLPVLDSTLELTVYGLFEGDEKFATKNRRIVTPALHWFRGKKRGQFDFDLDLYVQVGRSRATRAENDTEDLDHRAFYMHGTFAHTFDKSWSPRLSAEIDWVSGDRDPFDGSNGRFESMFGARRYDLAVAGLYGPFAYSNIISTGPRLSFTADNKRMSGFLSYRAVSLDSKRDAWTTTGLRDASGQSGRFVGNHIDLRLRYEIFPKNLRLELGLGHLVRGRFARDVGGSDESSTFVYTQLLGTL